MAAAQLLVVVIPYHNAMLIVEVVSAIAMRVIVTGTLAFALAFCPRRRVCQGRCERECRDDRYGDWGRSAFRHDGVLTNFKEPKQLAYL